MNKNINLEIAITHLLTSKKQSLIAVLGVAIGVAIYLFMNSLSSGFSDFSRNEIFKNTSHIKVFKEDEVSENINNSTDKNSLNIITNPQILDESKKIINPNLLLQQIKNQPNITEAVGEINFDISYKKSRTQIQGNGVGVNIDEYDSMHNLSKYVVAGSTQALKENPNGIMIGSGISEKLNLRITDNISVSSSKGVIRVLRIVGIFQTGNSMSDNKKSFVNISTAQQLIKEDASFLSTIYINTDDPDKAKGYSQRLQPLSNYKFEDWTTSNAEMISADKTRSSMMGAISFSILIVAGFGIFNILSTTISQKINDIAILKACGFKGKDVVNIFVIETLVMGFAGTICGLILAAILITIMSQIYMGPPVGYFPISIELGLFMRSFILGLLITLSAGYFPSLKAAKVDPIEIFRK
jgi:lipoprotein-releasing system permease protein